MTGFLPGDARDKPAPPLTPLAALRAERQLLPEGGGLAAHSEYVRPRGDFSFVVGVVNDSFPAPGGGVPQGRLADHLLSRLWAQLPGAWDFLARRVRRPYQDASGRTGFLYPKGGHPVGRAAARWLLAAVEPVAAWLGTPDIWLWRKAAYRACGRPVRPHPYDLEFAPALAGAAGGPWARQVLAGFERLWRGDCAATAAGAAAVLDAAGRPWGPLADPRRRRLARAALHDIRLTQLAVALALRVAAEAAGTAFAGPAVVESLRCCFVVADRVVECAAAAAGVLARLGAAADPDGGDGPAGRPAAAYGLMMTNSWGPGSHAVGGGSLVQQTPAGDWAHAHTLTGLPADPELYCGDRENDAAHTPGGDEAVWHFPHPVYAAVFGNSLCGRNPAWGDARPPAWAQAEARRWRAWAEAALGPLVGDTLCLTEREADLPRAVRAWRGGLVEAWLQDCALAWADAPVLADLLEDAGLDAGHPGNAAVLADLRLARPWGWGLARLALECGGGLAAVRPDPTPDPTRPEAGVPPPDPATVPGFLGGWDARLLGLGLAALAGRDPVGGLDHLYAPHEDEPVEAAP